MSKFIYRYDTVLRIKEVFEKKILKEISDIEKTIEKLEIDKKKLITKKEDLAQKITEGKIKVVDYKSAKSLCKTLEKEIAGVEKKIYEWQLKRKSKLDELIERKKEIQILEALKEKQYEEFLINSNREELKQLNEIAINNFNRKEQ
ncbi:flagellar export protein FliJ [Rosettibacter firmus]|uniref:flagellar export protein FliJ n=1 Tax=Rosettibacter firmus TaxID=3111522 RepID=UPI00336BDD59